ncbi:MULTISPECIES: hypothetical protein [unclassified Coleofasciculus]|uniref:hypothetical protein n=1 Tax=unclassified Coleofasciculus TaxID=2692782 RepID=UPI00187F5B93|nr:MULTISPECIES: hypothetical protein [unclassified Coleofasciculus]MBE9126437.1 hypothetical protein [Coleofasciculus sp. LEGE 07081]MBE9148039.1 hypothetical protein [Coleofasciculus sp. LEGE 07092]
MTNSTHLYGQLFNFLRQYSQARDLRHLKALGWMVTAQITRLAELEYKLNLAFQPNKIPRHKRTADPPLIRIRLLDHPSGRCRGHFA